MQHDIRNYAPDLGERLLLKALLDLNTSAARDAARVWLDRSDLEHLNEGHRRLMPFLYQRMTNFELEHPKISSVGREYRRFWISSKRGHFQVDQLSDVLSGLGAPVVFLKGTALSQTVYPAIALRPFMDLDILVHPQNFLAAKQLLVASGFEPQPSTAQHATTLVRKDYLDIDLHQSPYHEAYSEKLVAPIFSRLVALQHNGNNLYRLGNEDQLLHTIAHGLRWNVVSPVRWVVDASLQLRASGNTIDWDLLCREAIRLNLVEVAYRAFTILDSFCHDEIDAPTIARLERHRTFITNLWFAAEREWQGPSVVWGTARRNQNIFVSMVVFLKHYVYIAQSDGIRYLAKKAFARFGKILAGKVRE